MITFKKWLELNGDENQNVAALLGKSAAYISSLKQRDNLFVDEHNNLVRVSKVLELWEIES